MTTTTRPHWSHRLPALAVLLGAITLLQVHAIQFWMEFVGPMGWAWAVLLEGVAVWLWSQRQALRRVLALVTSLLALAGPLYAVCEPLVAEWQSAGSRDAGRELRIEQLQREASRLEETIATFRANSEARAGWLEPIQVAQARLQEVDHELAGLVAQPSAQALSWRQQALVVMQALALVIFQLAVVLAVTSLARQRQLVPADLGSVSASPTPTSRQVCVAPQDMGMGGAMASPLATDEAPCNLDAELGAPSMSEMNDEDELAMAKGHFTYADIVELRDALNQLLEEREITQAAFCRGHGISPRDLSLLQRHEERCSAGERTISATALERLARTLRDTAAGRVAT